MSETKALIPKCLPVANRRIQTLGGTASRRLNALKAAPIGHEEGNRSRTVRRSYPNAVSPKGCIVLLNVALFSCLSLCSNEPAFAQPATKNELPSIAMKTKGMKAIPGFFNLYLDEKRGAAWLGIDKMNTDLLYVEYLAQGLGSTDIGLNRGQLGYPRVVRFQRFGGKVLLIQSSTTLRSTSEDIRQQQAVTESFPQSVLWGFTIEAEEGDRVLVNATDFVLRDWHDDDDNGTSSIAGSLTATKQGTFKIDADRSVVYFARTNSFPNNTEFESLLTFGGEPAKDSKLQDVVPTPAALTVHIHHSFIRLPDVQYKSRAFDPRSGYFNLTSRDFSAAFNQPSTRKEIQRFRLTKTRSGQVEKPIVFYIDRGIPEPIRGAIIEGANWWKTAFDSIGYQNGFRAEEMPQTLDPMDIRYNTVQCVDGTDRGWSTGQAVVDPRTGEVLQGRVTLDCMRARYDFLLISALTPLYGADSTAFQTATAIVLERMKQLAAHEIGHVLGLRHNFAASAQDRVSVMDYPGPLLKLAGNGNLDFGGAYTKGLGPWDTAAIAYGYSELRSGMDEKAELDAILRKAAMDGLYVLSDADAGSSEGLSPFTQRWDNGQNPADELPRAMAVRRRALDLFGEETIPKGEPMSALENALVPVFLFHRYQIEAASKMLGGMDYRYNMRGDGQREALVIPPDEQRRALRTLLATLDPSELSLPDRIIRSIPPPALGYGRSSDNFTGHSGLSFDSLSPAEAVANLTVSLLLDPKRCYRLTEFNSRDPKYPGLGEVLNELISATWKTTPREGYPGAIQRVVDSVVITRLISLASDKQTPNNVRALVSLKIDDLKEWISEALKNLKDENRRADFRYALLQIEKRDATPGESSTPPGTGLPWGAADDRYCAFANR